MSVPYTTLNARVKQKLATEAYWLSIEDELGVIFEGEQAFVYSEDGVAVNFKIGDGTKKFSELPYFIAYYSNVLNQKVLPYINQSTNIAIPSTFRNLSELQQLSFYNTSGVVLNVKVGTTDGGAELGEFSVPVGESVIGLKKTFTTATPVYITGLSGHTYSLQLLYIQYDEAPAVPPSGSPTSTLFPNGFFGMFRPSYPGHENDVWDFVTGLGKTGTGYDNCALAGTNGVEPMGNMVPNGYEIGDTLMAEVGSNSITLVESQLPKFRVPLFLNYTNGLSHDRIVSGSDVAALGVRGSDASNYEMAKGYGPADPPASSYVGRSGPVGSGTSINILNKGRKVLYFAAIS